MNQISQGRTQVSSNLSLRESLLNAAMNTASDSHTVPQRENERVREGIWMMRIMRSQLSTAAQCQTNKKSGHGPLSIRKRKIVTWQPHTLATNYK